MTPVSTKAARESEERRTLGEKVNDRFQLFLEADLEDAVGLINDQALEVLEDEATGTLEMVEKATRSGDEETDSFDQLVSLRLAVSTSDHESMCLRVERHQVSYNSVRLEGQLASGRDDDHASTFPNVRRGPESEQTLNLPLRGRNRDL